MNEKLIKEYLSIEKLINCLFYEINYSYKLKKRIDKAIEYIKIDELLYYSGTDDEEMYSKFSINLLEILRGESEE